jgi:hypothetical protein
LEQGKRNKEQGKKEQDEEEETTQNPNLFFSFSSTWLCFWKPIPNRFASWILDFGVQIGELELILDLDFGVQIGESKLILDLGFWSSNG